MPKIINLQREFSCPVGSLDQFILPNNLPYDYLLVDTLDGTSSQCIHDQFTLSEQIRKADLSKIEQDNLMSIFNSQITAVQQQDVSITDADLFAMIKQRGYQSMSQLRNLSQDLLSFALQRRQSAAQQQQQQQQSNGQSDNTKS